MLGHSSYDERHQAMIVRWPTEEADFLAVDERTRHDFVGSGDLPLSTLLLRRTDAQVLAVHLHGALDRHRYSLPRFERMSSLQSLPYHHLFVADPTLATHERMRIGWFIGTEAQNATEQIGHVIRQAAVQLGATKVVITGSSAGGFGALALTPRVPDSLAVAISPQTNIGRFSNGTQAALLAESAFPSYDTYEEFAAAHAERVDLATFWTTHPGGRAWYVQNSGDLDHVSEHMEPFADAVDDRVTFVSEYHCAGHGAATVTRTRAWIERACEHFDEDPTEFSLGNQPPER